MNKKTVVKTINISRDLSFVPFQISLLTGDEKVISTATAFFYEFGNRTFLITNWHNVTGKNPHNFSLLSNATVALPSKMALHLPFNRGENLLGWETRVLPLYEDLDCDPPRKPVWYVHPKYGPKVDAVAIELDAKGTAVIPANHGSLRLEKLRLSVSMDAFVLGYPKGMSARNFALWKRATVASEPDIDVNDLPMFYIDTATRSGMSGAPVFVQITGFWAEEGKKLPQDGKFGTGVRFAGIYSGRLDDNEFQAQIGKVWKEDAICEIIQNKIVDKSSYEYVGA